MRRRSVPMHLICLAATVILLWATVLHSGLIQAEEPFPHHAGIVIQFGDGAVHKACVDLGDDGEATGEEVLRASGVSMVIEYAGAMGGTVCKINDEGCSFPAEPCFCQCTLRPGEPCTYWAYYHLKGGQWEYSQRGATNHTVHSGEVEGWAWGEGIPKSGGAQPPVIPFDQICIPPSPTPTNTPSPTDTPTPIPPTATPTATPIPPSPTPWPPTAMSIPMDTATPGPTATPPPTATSTDTPVPTSTTTSTPSAGVVSAQPEVHTDTPVPTPTPTDAPTSSATPLPELPTVTPTPSMTPPPTPTSTPTEVGSPRLFPTPSPYSALGINVHTPMPAAIPKGAMARAALATPTLIAVVPTAVDPTVGPNIATARTTAVKEAPGNGQGGRSYLLFGVLAGGLMAGLVVLRVRRQQ